MIVVACFTLAAALGGFAHARSGGYPAPARPQIADLLANPPTCLDAGDETPSDAAHSRQACLGCLLAQALPPVVPLEAAPRAWRAVAAIPGFDIATEGRRRSACSSRGPPSLPA